MRGRVWAILGMGMIFAVSPAWAQRYDPNYPVCMEIYDAYGSRMDCYFTSMDQCKEGAKSTPGICSNNPY